MKLISVSNFLEQYSDQIPGDKIDAIELRLALLDEPTVEAVPVEWIKEYATKFENKITDARLHGIGHAKGVYWRDENGEWVGVDFTNPITEMLESWKKENENVQ